MVGDGCPERWSFLLGPLVPNKPQTHGFVPSLEPVHESARMQLRESRLPS